MIRFAVIFVLFAARAASSQWTMGKKAALPPPPPPGGTSWSTILDPSRATDWSHVGVPGGIPNYTTICAGPISPTGIIQWQQSHAYAMGERISDGNGNLQEVITAGTSGASTMSQSNWTWSYTPKWATIVGSSTTDGTVTWELKSTTAGTDALEINRAIASPACANQSAVVQLAAGKFVLTLGIKMMGVSKLVLRGQGPMQTNLQFFNTVGCNAASFICLAPATGAPWSSSSTSYPCTATWDGGYAQGSTVIQVGVPPTGNPPTGKTCTFTTDMTAEPYIFGSIIRLDQREDSIGICPPTGGVGNCNGVSGATGVGTTATIVTTLEHHFHRGQTVYVGEVVGDFSCLRSDSTTVYTSCFNTSRAGNFNGNIGSSTTYPNPGPCDGFQMGCKWWTVTDIGCIVSGAYVTDSSCSPTDKIIAFKYEVPAAFPASMVPSGSGYAGTDTGGVFVDGTGGVHPNGSATIGSVIYLGTQSAGRKCTNGKINNVRSGVGDPQCEYGETSRRDYMEEHQVTAINGNQLTITPPIINTNFRAGQVPAIYWAADVVNLGVENLTIDGMFSGASVAGVQLSACYACWVRNVRTIWTGRTAVWTLDSSHDEIRDSYFYGSKNGQSTSYGLETLGNVTSFLAINNAMQRIVAPIMFDGDWGSVAAYNYMVEGGYHGPDIDLAMHIANHAFTGVDLHEGNNANGAAADNNHGVSSQVTWFRNRERGRDFPARQAPNVQAVNFFAWMRGYNYIGNVLGWPGNNTIYQQLGRPPRGPFNMVWYIGSGWQTPPDDPLAAAAAMRWGNYDTATPGTRWCGTGQEAGCQGSEIPGAFPFLNANFIPADHSLPASFFLGGQPNFWTTTWGTPGWPAIGPDVTASGPLDADCARDPHLPYSCDGVAGQHMSYQIPAQICFVKTPIDPAYQWTFNVLGAERTSNSPYGGTITFTLSGLDNTPGQTMYNLTGIRVGTTIDVKGVNSSGPGSFNGIYVVQTVCGKNTNHYSALQCTTGSGTAGNPIVPPYVTVYMESGAPNPGMYSGSGGTVTGPNIRAFDARNCYPGEGIP